MTFIDERQGFTVSRRVYGDPAVFAVEQERVLRRSWQFLAHESEIAAPGDYVTRRLVQDPVIVARDEEGEIRVFLNSCRHRGTTLCRAGLGNTSHFRCSYHGWTYANDGRLRGVTFQKEVYGDDLRKADFGLIQAPRTGVAHGLIFASWNPNALALEDELGPVDYYLKSIFGKFDSGLEVMGPPVHSRMPCTWKAESENLSGDGYHTPVTHQTAFTFGLFAKPEDLTVYGDVPEHKFRGRVVDCGRGHTIRVQHLPVVSQRPLFLGYPNELWPEIERNLDAGQVDIQSRLSVTHGTIFPSLGFLENFKTGTDGPDSACRYIRLTLKLPNAADSTDMLWWLLVPCDVSADWKRRSQRAYLRTSGPAGMFEVDDSENFNSISDSLRGEVARGSSLQLLGGIDHAVANDVPWPGDVRDADRSEHTIRAWLRRWEELMEDDTPVAAPAGPCR